ncbi:MAG: molybdopterin cofactor-binding domain-containing protein [Bryobacteraceae bacterium]
MADEIEVKENFEPERYELREGPAHVFSVNRREFAGVAGGILIAVSAQEARAQRGGRGGQGGAGGSGTLESRLVIGTDGTATVLTGKVEVGQGSRTELAMAAAEELRMPIDKVRVVMADTDLAPNDGITAGSRTTPATVPAVRSAAAAARELLLEVASRNLQTDKSRLQIRDGAASLGGSDKKFGYADLARSPELAAANKQAAPSSAVITPVKEWKLLGTPVPRTDGRDIVTGAHRFPSDVVRPRMLYGAVLRPPSYGASLASADIAPAQKIAGVTAVKEGGFVGCAAPTSFAARKAVEAIAPTAKWDIKDHVSSSRLFAHLKETAAKDDGDSARRPRVQAKGSIDKGLEQAQKRMKATYQVAYIQHAPMEPRAAVAEWQGGRLTVWTGTQNPHGVRDQLVQAFHLTPDKVRVIVPDTGGGFGGKHTVETAIEAARLAKESGKPVSLRWTRAEEFMWAYFRPAGLFEVEGGLDSKGLIAAWDFSNYLSGTAAIESPYRIANSRTRFLSCDAPLRGGSYRGIAATANNFARECFMDELAGAAGADPLEFRLANLENPRLRDVLIAAAKSFRWDERRKNRRKGAGIGLAGGTEKGSYVAACAEIEAAGDGGIRIRDFHMAYECGAILNPANLRAQIEGSIVQGLGGALTEEIEFEGGRLKNGSFAKYRVPRFRDVPPIEIQMLNRPDLPSVGAGETPIIAVAPAIANAAFDLNGVRARSMPVRLKKA